MCTYQWLSWVCTARTLSDTYNTECQTVTHNTECQAYLTEKVVQLHHYFWSVMISFLIECGKICVNIFSCIWSVRQKYLYVYYSIDLQYSVCLLYYCSVP